MEDTQQPTWSAQQERLARDLRAVVADAEALLALAVRDAGSAYDETRAQLERSLSAARAQLATLPREAADRAMDAGRAADNYVHQHPWPAVGIGAGIGFLLGLLLGRR